MPSSKLFVIVMLTVGLSCAAAAGADRSDQTPEYGRASDPHGFDVFLKEGGWCWFQDPRAIIHEGKLVLGGVQGNESGDAVVGIFDLQDKRRLGRVVLHEGFKHDDHNSPAFYARPEGGVLAVYALHGDNKTHYYRVSDPDDLLDWGEEKRFQHDYPNAGNVTYMNLHALKNEGKLYNFFRGIDWNPCFITSTDEGAAWGEQHEFICSQLAGRQRPYVRYVSNNLDTVYFSFTDAHPHVFGNNIYFAAFREGNFYKADGTLIKNLHDDGPLVPREAEIVFQGGGGSNRRQRVSADRSAWTSSMAIDQYGYPHIGYSLYLSNADHRYRIASWNGKKWMDREVAYGGTCLYESESSYTGLVTLDPLDPGHVVISTDVDPATGRDLGSRHEIYRAQVKPNDDLAGIKWEPVTRNSPVRNLRPIVVSGEGHRVILWLRGDFVTYTSYQLDVVGVVETLKQ